MIHLITIGYMAIDWTQNYKKYKGLWVALEENQQTVFASGKTAKETLEKAQMKGLPQAILFRVPAMVLSYLCFAIEKSA